MSIITLITDFGNKDHFVAKIKGDIYSNYNEAKIVDVSNNVSPFNIMEAAYILENSYKSFPDKTVHIIDVDSEKTAEKKHIIVYLDNHFFKPKMIILVESNIGMIFGQYQIGSLKRCLQSFNLMTLF